MKIDKYKIKQTDKYIYLGTIINREKNLENEINNKLRKKLRKIIIHAE